MAATGERETAFQVDVLFQGVGNNVYQYFAAYWLITATCIF